MLARLLWFSFPFDFIRIYWVITPMDVVAALYLLDGIFSGKMNKNILIIFSLCVLPLLFIVLASGIVNYSIIDQHLILFIGLFISALKGLALVDFMSRSKSIDFLSMAYGFLVINVISFVLLIGGFGVSGAGRGQGIIGHSNAFGLFQAFSFALALAIINLYRKLSIILIFVSIVLIIFSGSRGALLTAIVLFFIFYLLNFKTYGRKFLKLLLVFVGVIGLSFIYLNELVLYLYKLDFAGSSRIANFIDVLLADRVSIFIEMQDARGSLNKSAWEAFVMDPKLLGSGYGEALLVINAEARPHNIFYSSIIELGILGALYFIVVFSYAGFYSFKAYVYKKENIWILFFFICFFLAAIRTPFYLLAAMPWFVIFSSIYLGRKFGKVFIG
jgi:O-antigen ligase